MKAWILERRDCSVSEVSFAILRRAALRVLTLRGLTLLFDESGSGSDNAYRVTVGLDGSMTNDRYRIETGTEGAMLTAANDCAVHAALGRLFLECRFDGRGGFVPAAAGTVIDFTPDKPLRGMYFATHCYNFYHSAPLPEVYEVVEDLAMRGCNSLLVWFDMHHFTGMDDPGAQELVGRLHAILKYANDIGMGGSLTMNANEGFSTSPVELRAEWMPQGRYKARIHDHFHCEICPSKPGGIEEILRERRQVFSYFTDIRIDYVVYWPYDEGGCTCMDCQPWGSNGFMKLFPYYRDLVREMFPNTKIIMSTWYFDLFIDGEWDEFYPQMTPENLDGVRFVMSFFSRGQKPACITEKGIPQGIEFIDFPEISMYRCRPWGGFGATMLASFLQETNSASGTLYKGGFPYSEGIYEDANKFIQLSFYSGLYRDAFDALRAYLRFEFCCEDERLFEAIRRVETGQWRDRLDKQSPHQYPIHDTSDIDFVYETLTEYNEKLPENIAKSRKFRLFYLRAVIDYELARNDFTPSRSKRCQEAMAELYAIYHASEKTGPWVCPPVGK